MRKLKNILLLIAIFCMIGTINVYAAEIGILLQGDDTAKASETKNLDVKLQAEADMRRGTI